MLKIMTLLSRTVASLVIALFALSGCAGSVEQATTVSSTFPDSTVPESTVPKIVVPDLRTLNRDQAFQTLRDLGLTAAFEAKPSSGEIDLIVSHDPRRGTEVDAGSQITLFYSVPLLRSVSVRFEVEQGLFSSLGNDECEHRDSKSEAGQSMRLIGPDGADLSSVLIGNGRDMWVRCQWDFVFRDVPEVATYRLVTPDGRIFPAVSQAEMQSQWQPEWRTSWKIFRR